MNNKLPLLGCLALLVMGLFVAGIGGCTSYNGLVGKSEAVDKQWGQVEAAYQRRADLIPNLVKTLEAQATFEKSTLTEIANARSSINQIRLAPGQVPDEAMMAQFEKAQAQMSGALGRMMAISENYPQLKANEGFRSLSDELAGTENRINMERLRFNDAAQVYNTSVKRFPASIVAGIGGFHPNAYFNSAAGSEKAPEVQFNLGQPKRAEAQ